MTHLVRKFTGLNWPLFGLVIALGLFGIFAIYSATWMREQDFWNRQLVWLCFGLVLCVAVAMTDYRWVRKGALPLYLAGLVGLIVVHFFGETVYGARSWLDFGFMNFPPSQLAIVAAIMLMALFLAEYEPMPAPLRIALCGLITAVPFVLILIQPDLGSAIVWMPVIHNQ
jgi:rod shape determining protein RodA